MPAPAASTHTRAFFCATVATLARLWCAPLSLAGLALAAGAWLAGPGSVRLQGTRALWLASAVQPSMGGQSPNALWISSPGLAWLLRRHPLGAMQAVAVGEVVLAALPSPGAQLLAHELCHVAQARRWGLLFPLAYGGASLGALLRGQDVYLANRFEVAARAAENDEAPGAA